MKQDWHEAIDLYREDSADACAVRCHVLGSVAEHVVVRTHGAVLH